jgi:translation initiation factor 2A
MYLLLTKDREAIDRELASGLSATKIKSQRSIPGLNPQKSGKKKNNIPSNDAPASTTTPAQGDLEKKIRNINKKLKNIVDLKEKRDSGAPLELTQISKIESEAKLLQEVL